MGETVTASAEQDARSAAILDAVVRLIEEHGYDSVELRPVAREARVSLATIYSRFGSRDALLLAAVEHWMGEHVYSPLRHPDPAETVSDRLVGLFQQLFAPWVRHPRMLEAHIRAVQDGGGGRLFALGQSVVHPLTIECFGEDAEETFVREVGLILAHVTYSVMAQVASGTMAAEEILPVVEMTVKRLTALPPSPARTPANKAKARPRRVR